MALLQPLDHRPTRMALDRERRLLGDFPDPEDAVTVVDHSDLGLLGFKRDADGHVATLFDRPLAIGSEVAAFDAVALAQTTVAEPLPLPANLGDSPAIYIAHHRCVPANFDWPMRPRVWTAGTPSWRKLARRGIWVEGCTDHLGFAAMSGEIRQALFQLPALHRWAVLTHAEAVASWRDSGVGRVVASYRNNSMPLPGEVIEHALSARYFYWSSPQQYQRLRTFVSADASHAAGPGKTAQFLREQGISNVTVFPSRAVWRKWLT